MNDTLKPCPFCGKAGKITKKEYNFLGTGFIPHCSNGSCLMFTARKEYKAENGAKQVWNRRFADKDDFCNYGKKRGNDDAEIH